MQSYRVRFPTPPGIVILCLATALAVASPAAGTVASIVRYSAVGSFTSHATLQSAIDAAQPGDRIDLPAGTFAEAVTTRSGGTAEAPITLRGSAAGQTVLTNAGRVLTLQHPWWRIEGIAIDGQYGADDAVRISGGAQFTTLSGVEVRRAGRDCVDLSSGADDVTIESSTIHHCLNSADGRSDAHGIVAGAVRRLTIRSTEIHTFSGDAFQVDPGRSSRGWDEVTIQGSHFWLEPLPQAENGFPAGVTPGENGIDTKVYADGPRARLRVTDTIFHGFRDGLISNMAALNLKERVDATIDAVTVYDSEIAFRLRGPETTGALVAITNSVVHDVATAFRYEDDIQGLRVWFSTIGASVARPFQRASSSASVLDVRNVLLLGSSLPSEAAHASNRAVAASVFQDATKHDYRLRAGASAIDTGVPIAGVTVDRYGVPRPYGQAPDAGAFEWCGNCPAPARNLRMRQVESSPHAHPPRRRCPTELHEDCPGRARAAPRSGVVCHHAGAHGPALRRGDVRHLLRPAGHPASRRGPRRRLRQPRAADRRDHVDVRAAAPRAGPDVVLVVGDVNSTIACALVASKLGITVAHVEAGLRSYDRTMPEEINRVLTDQISDLLFTTEREAATNLAREGIAAERIHFVGNVMIDTLLAHREHALASFDRGVLGFPAGHYALLTLHRPSNVDHAESFERVMVGLQHVAHDLPLVFPVHPRTRPAITRSPTARALLDAHRLTLLDPLGYLEFLGAMASATVVLTDSGGVQEETTVLGVPCLTLRENTERPVTITQGTNQLVGSDPARIASAWDAVKAHPPAGRMPELWDGHAAERIAAVLRKQLPE